MSARWTGHCHRGDGVPCTQVPDSDALQADACGTSYAYDSNTCLVLKRKNEMRRRGAAGPAEWGAVALTSAESLAPSGFRRLIEYPPDGVA
jgi:hypothetical protein